MANINIKVPALGEGITDVTITKWLVNEGDNVEAEQPIVEIATDKVDSEISASEDGIIHKINIQENNVAQVGETIAIIETEKENENKFETDDNTLEEDFLDLNSNKNSEILEKTDLDTITFQKHIFIPPYIRSMAIEYELTNEELYSIKANGENDELTIEDVKNYIINRKKIVTSSKIKIPSSKTSNNQVIDMSGFHENSEIIEMDRMRKLIAEHMVRSKLTAPHVTSFIEADVTNLVTWRNGIKENFAKKFGEKLTFTPIFVEAVVKALKKHPMVNASVDDKHIYLKKNINVGVATALTNGNLIVPVIKDADQENLIGLATKVNDIVSRARLNKLTATEVKGGTFTLTNLGNFESLAGTPIINQPEVAILAIGAITRKPAVVKVNNQETIGIRDIVMLSLAYDHRIIDGSLGGMFLKSVRDSLQEFDINRRVV